MFWMTSRKWNLDAHFYLSHFKSLDARIFCMEGTTCLASWMTHKWRHSGIGILHIRSLIKDLALLINKASSCNKASYILLLGYQREKQEIFKFAKVRSPPKFELLLEGSTWCLQGNGRSSSASLSTPQLITQV